MKTLKEKGITGWTIAGVAVVFISYFAVIAAVPSPDFENAVNNDIAKIERSENSVALHKEQLKQSKAEGDKAGVIAAKSDLCKAKADLKRDRAYLKSDKKALVQVHKDEMSPTASVLKENKRELCDAKRQLKKDMRQGNTSALVDDAQLVVQKQKALDRSEAKLDRQETALDAKLTAIDKRLEQNNGEAAKTARQDKDDQSKFAWNATASADKTYYEPKETVSTQGSSAVLEK